MAMISLPYQVSDLISQDIRTVNTTSQWLIANLGTVKYKLLLKSLRNYHMYIVRLLRTKFVLALYLWNVREQFHVIIVTSTFVMGPLLENDGIIQNFCNNRSSHHASKTTPIL